MFCSAVSVGSRLNDWNTKPTRLRRSLVSALSLSPDSSVPPIRTEPEVTLSRPARQCMSVDFPEPDGPMIAVNSPAAKATVTPLRARTAVSPDPYTLTMSAAATAVPAGASTGMRPSVGVMRPRQPVGTRAGSVVHPER
jgi:hypothetical protein